MNTWLNRRNLICCVLPLLTLMLWGTSTGRAAEAKNTALKVEVTGKLDYSDAVKLYAIDQHLGEGKDAIRVIAHLGFGARQDIREQVTKLVGKNVTVTGTVTWMG